MQFSYSIASGCKTISHDPAILNRAGPFPSGQRYTVTTATSDTWTPNLSYGRKYIFMLKDNRVHALITNMHRKEEIIYIYICRIRIYTLYTYNICSYMANLGRGHNMTYCRLRETPGHINACLRSLTTKARFSVASSPAMPLVNLSSSFSCHPCQHQWNSRICRYIYVYIYIYRYILWDDGTYTYLFFIYGKMYISMMICQYAPQIQVLWLLPLALMRLSERSLRLTMQMLTDGSATTGPEVVR